MKLGRWDDGLALLDSLGSTALNHETLYFQCTCYMALKDTMKAYALLERIDINTCSHLPLVKACAHVYILLGGYSKAIVALDRCINGS